MKTTLFIALTLILTSPALAQVESEQAAPVARDWQNPAVRAAVELPRRRPSDYIRATLNLLDLDEPELAGQAFTELAAIELDDAARATLVREVGSAAMLKLSRAEALGPEAAAFAQQAMQAAAAEAASPERISEFVAQLGDENDRVQRSAVAELAAAGEVAVLPTLAVLANADATDRQRTGARAALLRMSPLSDGPLLAALDSGDEPLVSEAAALLASLEVPQAAAKLARRAVTSSGGSTIEQAYSQLTGQPASIESAEGLLTRTLDRLASGVPAFRADDTGNGTYWYWDAKALKPIPLAIPSADATLLYRADLAADLAALRPQDVRLQSQAIRLGLEKVEVLGLANLAVGANLSNYDALTAGSLDRVLSDALDAGQYYAAEIMLIVIAERRDPGMLYTGDGKPSPTARALKSPHPKVRAAALDAIAAIDSPSPFPGASYVCPAIVRMATAGGDRVVVAAAPQSEEAANWAGGLAGLGYEGQVATTGADAIELATQRADVELVLIDMAIGRPAVREVVFQLRRNPGTALLPIGLLAREPQYTTARRIASEHERVMQFPRPHSDELLVSLAETLTAELPRDWPTAEERAGQAERAIAIMDQLLAAGREFYRLRAASDMITGTLRVGNENTAAWRLLAKLGTAGSQQALVDYASNATLPIADRQAAVTALADSIDRFGILLSSDSILRQYDLYNRSEREPQETQQVLSDVLDAIEAPRKAQQKSLTPDP